MSIIFSILSFIVGAFAVIVGATGIYSVFIRDASATPFMNAVLGGISCAIAYFVSAPFKLAYEEIGMSMLAYILVSLVGCAVLSSTFEIYALPSIFSSVSLVLLGVLITGVIPFEIITPVLDVLVSVVSWGFIPFFIIVVIFLALSGSFRWP